VASKRNKPHGYQKRGILYIVKRILEEEKKPMTDKELHKIALEKGYREPSRLKEPNEFIRLVRADILRRGTGSVFQITGYRQAGLKEWGYPKFDEAEHKRKLKVKRKREKLANKRVSIMSAIIEALEKKGEPMRVKEIFDYVIKKKNVVFRTKTPFKTLNSNITWEINKKGDKSRFIRISRGLIGLGKWY